MFFLFLEHKVIAETKNFTTLIAVKPFTCNNVWFGVFVFCDHQTFWFCQSFFFEYLFKANIHSSFLHIWFICLCEWVKVESLILVLIIFFMEIIQYMNDRQQAMRQTRKRKSFFFRKKFQRNTIWSTHKHTQVMDNGNNSFIFFYFFVVQIKFKNKNCHFVCVCLWTLLPNTKRKKLLSSSS